MDSLYLTCSACNTEFFPGQSCEFTLKCGHFRCIPCTSYLNPCELDGNSENFNIKDNIENFQQKCPEIFNLTCELHKSLLELYCKTCELLICYRCVLVHKNHDVLEESQLESVVPSMTNKFNSHVSSVLSKFNQSCQELKSIQDSIKESNESILRLEESFPIEVDKKQQEISKQIDSDFDIFYKINQKALQKCVMFASVFQDFKELVELLALYIEKKMRMLKEPRENSEFLMDLSQLHIESFTFEFSSWPCTQFVKYIFSQDDLSIEEKRYIYHKCNS